ncbi:MAG: serine/threonine-protein kinase [Planctomycetota bacterium]
MSRTDDASPPSVPPSLLSFAERAQREHGDVLAHDTPAPASVSLPSSTGEILKRLAAHSERAQRYVVRGEIARGGMGAVLEVWEEDLHRSLAMKVAIDVEIAPAGHVSDRGLPKLARFLEEAQVTAQLDHPGIVPVHELGLDDAGRIYFTMKRVAGRTLAQVFELVAQKRDGWNETRALYVLLKACDAVSYAHKKAVIHRDLKPANVMVGSFGEVYVMDWGLARVVGREDRHDMRLRPQSEMLTSVHTDRRGVREDTPNSPLMTMDGAVLGTPAYMSPEQARNEVERLGPRSDVYAIGAMLYHLLSGQAPYLPRGSRVASHVVLRWLLEGPPQPLHEIRQDLPAELGAICEKAMARDPDQRYADMRELADDLRAYLENRVVSAYETGSLAEMKKWIRRNKGVAVSTAAGILVAFAALGWVSYVQADAKHAIERKHEQLQTANAGLIEAQLVARRNEAEARSNADRFEAEKSRADAEAKWTFRVASVLANSHESAEGFARFADDWSSHLQTLRARSAPDDIDLVKHECLYVLWRWRRAMKDTAKSPERRREQLEPWGPLVERAYAQLRKRVEPHDPLWSEVLNSLYQWISISGDAFASQSSGTLRCLPREVCEQLAPLQDESLESFSAIHGSTSAPALVIAAERIWMAVCAGDRERAADVAREYLDRRRLGGEPAAFLDSVHKGIIDRLERDHLAPPWAPELRWRSYVDSLRIFRRGSSGYNASRHAYEAHLVRGQEFYAPERCTDSLAYHLSLVAIGAGAGDAALAFIAPLSERLLRERDSCDPHRWIVRRVHAKALMTSGRFQQAASILDAYLESVNECFGSGHALAIDGVLVRAELLERQTDFVASRAAYDSARSLVHSRGDEYLSVLRGVLMAAAAFERRAGSHELAARYDSELDALNGEFERRPRNLNFEHGENLVPPEGWLAVQPPEKAAGEWQAFAYATSNSAFEGKLCAVLSTLPGASEANGENARRLMATFDAAPYKDRRLRFRAAVRTSCRTDRDFARLWLACEGNRGDANFLTNAQGPAIRTDDWQHYDVVKHIESDTNRIAIGIDVFGDAEAWIDEVTIEVVSD